MVWHLCGMAILVGVACAGICSAAPTPPPVSGSWSLAFDQEFDQPLNPNVWTQTLWGLSTFGPNEMEAYAPSGVSSGGGMLALTARQQTLDGMPYVSGLIDTGPALDKTSAAYSFTYGYVEASIKLVSGQGLWPAFWMLPDPGPLGGYHDNLGEIDIMEELGNQPTIDEVHYHQNGSAWGGGIATGINLSQGFHTYAVNWQPGSLTYYLDGKEIYTINQAPSVAEYLILNLAVGAAGSWPGAPNSTTAFPSSLDVESVQVWQNSVPEPSSAWVGAAFVVFLLCRRPGRVSLVGQTFLSV